MSDVIPVAVQHPILLDEASKEAIEDTGGPIVVLFQCPFKCNTFPIKFRIWNNSSSCFMCSTSKIF